jgi:type VI secretion system secreted protein VgrG
LGLLNPVKTGVGFVNSFLGIRNMAAGEAKMATGTAAIPFTAGVSGASAYAIGIQKLVFGFANLNRGIGQMSEAYDELPCQSSFKNLLGLAPFGQKYDDALEPGLIEYFEGLGKDIVVDPWNASKQAAKDFFAFD